jgi:hypothetical protein
MSIEAMKQALEALKSCSGVPHWPALQPSITAIRAAIEQAEKQEPVAWALQFIDDDDDEEDDDPVFEIYESERRCRADAKRDGGVCKPLYLTPHQRKWVGLTDDEAMQTWDGIIKYAPGEVRVKDFARAIESKLKEKNT